MMASHGGFMLASQWDSRQLDIMWAQLEQQINPFTSVISIPGNIYAILDEGAKFFIARKFMNHVFERVMFCRDGTGKDRWFLGAPRHFVSHGGMILIINGSEPCWTIPETGRIQVAELKAPLVVEKPTKIPRPPNAYILYRKEHHNAVKASNPGITNNEISQVLGKAWNQESRETRQKYKTMSENIKKNLLQKYPDYQYKPRKPSEKKRRARKSVNLPTDDGLTASPESAFDDSSVLDPQTPL